jgi:hypothetical protein
MTREWSFRSLFINKFINCDFFVDFLIAQRLSKTVKKESPRMVRKEKFCAAEIEYHVSID